jgi:hypothetical protein
MNPLRPNRNPLFLIFVMSAWAVTIKSMVPSGCLRIAWRSSSVRSAD